VFVLEIHDDRIGWVRVRRINDRQEALLQAALLATTDGHSYRVMSPAGVEAFHARSK
jgi:hypothetical protein